MKIRSRRFENEPRIMVIPMIDIMFFLLVFFMLSTLHMVEQKMLPLNLPQAETGASGELDAIPIMVYEDGTIAIGTGKVSVEGLRGKLREELSRNAESRFIIRADKQTTYGRVVYVLDSLKQLGVTRLTIAVEPGSP